MPEAPLVVPSDGFDVWEALPKLQATRQIKCQCAYRKTLYQQSYSAEAPQRIVGQEYSPDGLINELLASLEKVNGIGQAVSVNVQMAAKSRDPDLA